MTAKKVKNEFDLYDCEFTRAELESIATALSDRHDDPVSDSLYQGIQFYLEKLPQPGEDSESAPNPAKEKAGQALAPMGGENELDLDHPPTAMHDQEPDEEPDYDLDKEAEPEPAEA